MKLLTLIVVFGFAINLNSQSNTKTFDLKKFLELKADSKIEYTSPIKSVNELNQIIYLSEIDNFYFVSVRDSGSNFFHNYYYDKKNLLLSNDYTSFHGIIIGNTNYYNENGDLVRIKNNDENYQLSITDLIKIIKDKFKTDLTVSNIKCNIDRTTFIKKESEIPVYRVSIDSTRKYWNKIIIVDGNSGDILRVSEIPMEN